MEEKKTIIPDFMEKYYQGSDMEGQAILQNLASNYEKQRQEYMMTTHAYQTATHKAIYGGMAKEIDPDIGLASVKEKFKAKAENIAVDNGYVEPQIEEDPEPVREFKPDRQAFLDRLRTMRENQPVNKQQATTDNDTIRAKDLNQRQQFLENMQSMRERQVVSRKPRL
ncbi:MAG: hypothetical protein EOO01_19300 [Chitinophagaceae bacterium]|nr:MAG: hypothetical protein EOO01_19300 [Chitinophagaceae bacterium]